MLLRVMAIFTFHTAMKILYKRVAGSNFPKFENHNTPKKNNFNDFQTLNYGALFVK